MAAAVTLTLGACSQPLSNQEKGALIGGGAGAAGEQKGKREWDDD